MALFSFEKDCEACVFPQLTNRQVLLEKLRLYHFVLHAFPAVRQTVIFSDYTLHPLTPWNLQSIRHRHTVWVLGVNRGILPLVSLVLAAKEML